LLAEKDVGKLEGWFRGVASAFPIVVGYIPIGVAFGVLAIKAGLSPANTMFLSLIVYAGSSQLIAVGLFEVQAPAIAIILTTFVVNLRHMLMSAAISTYLGKWKKSEIAAFAFQLTDETFAVLSVKFKAGLRPKSEVFGLNVTTQLGWLLGTWIGLSAGQLVGDAEALALDYALPAMFLALLVLQIENLLHIGIAILAGFLSVVFLTGGVGQWNVILAALSGATVGVIIEQWMKKQSS
jgi:4-azaleucine resistance transporter AzlC